MARKRKVDESFKSYRSSLKEEALVLKRKLAGKVIWPGTWGTERKIFIGDKMFLVGSGHKVAVA